jgi:arylsulfatase A-like enzyme
MNVVLITVDCLRFDRLKVYGGKSIVMPTVDKLATHGVVFEEVITAANATDPSHASIFTSCYPNSHGVLENAVVFHPSGHTTLAEAFSNAGYKTCGIVSVEHLSSPFGLNKGFHDYYNNHPLSNLFYSIAVKNRLLLVGLTLLRRYISPLNTHWRKADETTKIVLRWLKENSKLTSSRFFLWIHYFDAHCHYHSWSTYDELLTFIDFNIAQVIDFVQSNCEETLFVITADHGENFVPSHRVALRHGHSVRDDIIKVPLIFTRIPSAENEPKRISSQVRTIDIAPTLLDLCGIPVPEAWEGVSLRPWMERRRKDDLDAIFYGYPRWLNCVGIRSGGWKLILYKNRPQELFNVRKDPEEKVNCIADFPEVAKSLMTKLGKHAQVLDIELPEIGDSRVKEMLKSLGYLD